MFGSKIFLNVLLKTFNYLHGKRVDRKKRVDPFTCRAERSIYFKVIAVKTNWVNWSHSSD